MRVRMPTSSIEKSYKFMGIYIISYAIIASASPTHSLAVCYWPIIRTELPKANPRIVCWSDIVAGKLVLYIWLHTLYTAIQQIYKQRSMQSRSVSTQT